MASHLRIDDGAASTGAGITGTAAAAASRVTGEFDDKGGDPDLLPPLVVEKTPGHAKWLG